MQGKKWARPVAKPILCSECEAPLTDEETIWYGGQCEHCTVALDNRLRDDMAVD